MLSDEEKNSMELDIEAKYVGRTEKEFLNNITYVECLYILDTKNKYCDDIKNLSLLKIVDIVNEQSKEIEELKEKNKTLKSLQNDTNELYIEMTERKNYFERELQKVEDKIKAKIEELIKEGNYRTADNPNGRVHFQKEITYYQIEVLQSLLEKE